MPSAPSTQLIGAMLAPIQIQNWWATVEVRAFSGMGIRVCSAASVAPRSSALIDTVPPALPGWRLPGSQFPPCIFCQGMLSDQSTLGSTRGGVVSVDVSSTPDEGEVGPRLRQLREQKAMSARQVAELAGVSPAYLSRLENGRVSPTVATLARLVAAMGETMATLFQDTPSSEPMVVRHRSEERRVGKRGRS